MADHTPRVGLAALVGAVGICCGLPVLATLGVLGFVTGVSMASWTLVVFGVVMAVLGLRSLRTRRGGTP
jgi:hypothetical protein